MRLTDAAQKALDKARAEGMVDEGKLVNLPVSGSDNCHDDGRDHVLESEFQAQVIELARSYGWKCAHFRTVRVQRKNGSVHYQTPVQADGAGWPDLVLIHPRSGRVVVAELKCGKNKCTPQQTLWLAAWRLAAQQTPNVYVYVWTPEDMGAIRFILKGE